MMEDTKEHPLLTRLPDDADWEEFDNLLLYRQCLVRKIAKDQTTRYHKIRVLKEYRRTHVTEVRKRPWHRSPSRVIREEISLRINISTYQITQAKDRGSLNGVVFWKEFTFSDAKGLTYVVAFKEIPSCTCPSPSMWYHCDHILYLLLVVLNCPEPLCWQAAFMPSELEVIYRHSHAVRTLFVHQKPTRNALCVYCFKRLDTQPAGRCTLCARLFHQDCAKAISKVRNINQGRRGCWICEDKSEWSYRKFCNANQVPAATTDVAAVTATTTTATIAPRGPTSTANIAQQFIERKDRDDHGVGSSSSSKKQADRETQVNDNPQVNQRPSHPSQSSLLLSSSSSNFSTPPQSTAKEPELLLRPHSQQHSTSKKILSQLKGSTPAPAVSLQRSTSAPPTSNPEPTRLELKQHKAQERAEQSPRGVSQDFNPASAKSLSSVPSVHYPNLNASAPRASLLEQAGQTPVLLADGVDSHNSAATTATVTAQTAPPVSPDNISDDVGCSSPVDKTNADIHRKKAARLIRKCRRLERKSARIEKHVKGKIDREYKLELMMLKEKRKIKYMRIEKKWEHDLKGLRHEREKLEEKLKDLD